MVLIDASFSYFLPLLLRFETGRATVLPVNDDEALRAAFELTRLEGIIPALESSHALALLPKMKFRPDEVVVLTVSGRGDKDLDTYLKHMPQQETKNK